MRQRERHAVRDQVALQIALCCPGPHPKVHTQLSRYRVRPVLAVYPDFQACWLLWASDLREAGC